MARYGQAKREHTKRSKERIRAARLMDLLTKCAEGQHEMTMVQIRAAVAVLNRLQPELKSVEFTGSVTHRTESELSLRELEELVAGYAAGGKRTPAPEESAAGADPVH